MIQSGYLLRCGWLWMGSWTNTYPYNQHNRQHQDYCPANPHDSTKLLTSTTIYTISTYNRLPPCPHFSSIYSFIYTYLFILLLDIDNSICYNILIEQFIDYGMDTMAIKHKCLHSNKLAVQNHNNILDKWYGHFRGLK